VPTDPQRRAARPRPTRHRERAWLDLVSGRAVGLSATLARFGLWLLAGLYRAGLALARLRYRLPGAARRIARPVVSVGNLTLGGTGKTPMAAFLARIVTEMGGRPIIVSRGYGAAAGAPNEETMELARLCPSVPCVQNHNRWQAIHDWMWRHPCDLAILDDGFQHRRLARDLDIVLVDALQPFGYGHVLPRGLLREPPSALQRADMVILTRAELVGPEEIAALKNRLQRLARTGVPLLVAEHRPDALVRADGTRQAPESLRGETVAAACGIGNPEAFRRSLERLGARVDLWDVFPDHHAYSAADVERLLSAARSAGLKRLVTTVKDYVKWEPLVAARPERPAVEIVALEVRMTMVEGDERLRREIRSLLPGCPDSGPGRRAG
jgi:tetraacyldisaccharide 4'-kinase